MAKYTKKAPTYYDENGVLHEGMTQQEYEDQKKSMYDTTISDYLNARNQVLSNGKTADEMYQQLRALVQSDAFQKQSPERQKLILDTAKDVEDQLGYTYFNTPNSGINRGDNLSRAGVNRNKFAQKYGYNDWMDLYNNIGVKPQDTPRSIYDTSIREATNNPLANLTEGQINALAFQAAAGTEFNDQKDLAGVINQINQWNGRGNDGKPVNQINGGYNGSTNMAPNNASQITYNNGGHTESYNTPSNEFGVYPNGKGPWMTKGRSPDTPLASGVSSDNTAIAPVFGGRGGSEISGTQTTVPVAYSRQGGTGGGVNMNKFGGILL